jgi:hypothetical protein
VTLVFQLGKAVQNGEGTSVSVSQKMPKTFLENNKKGSQTGASIMYVHT